MIKRLLWSLAALLGLLIAVGVLLPDTIHLEGSTEIGSPVCTVYAQLDDPRRFLLWTPMAPPEGNGMTLSHSGPARGTGARVSWSRDPRQVGARSLEILAADPFQEVRTLLRCGTKKQANIVFRLASTDEGDTTVRWSADLKLEGGLWQRYGSLMLGGKNGKTLEESLARLKTMAEDLPLEPWCAYDLAILDVPPKILASIPGRSGQRTEEISAALGQAFGAVMSFLQDNGLAQAGPPLALNEEYGADGYRFQAGIPLAEDPLLEDDNSGVVVSTMPATRAVRLVHVGPYSTMTDSYHALVAFLAARGLEATGPAWEEYVSDPGDTPEDRLLTHIYIPVRSDRGTP